MFLQTFIKGLVKRGIKNKKNFKTSQIKWNKMEERKEIKKQFKFTCILL